MWNGERDIFLPSSAFPISRNLCCALDSPTSKIISHSNCWSSTSTPTTVLGSEMQCPSPVGGFSAVEEVINTSWFQVVIVAVIKQGKQIEGDRRYCFSYRGQSWLRKRVILSRGGGNESEACQAWGTAFQSAESPEQAKLGAGCSGSSRFPQEHVEHPAVHKQILAKWSEIGQCAWGMLRLLVPRPY